MPKRVFVNINSTHTHTNKCQEEEGTVVEGTAAMEVEEGEVVIMEEDTVVMEEVDGEVEEAVLTLDFLMGAGMEGTEVITEDIL